MTSPTAFLTQRIPVLPIAASLVAVVSELKVPEAPSHHQIVDHIIDITFFMKWSDKEIFSESEETD